jgi:hypothetical protein
MRFRFALMVFAIAGSAAALALPSCSDIPNKTCFADQVHAFIDEAGTKNVECSRCLQTKGAPEACCDLVGACQDDPTKGCSNEIQAAHQCVLEGGAAQESLCKGHLQSQASKDLYACMRGKCAGECGVPSCDVDPSVVLLASPTCDTCIGGSCCTEINACYKNRRCKLALECIIHDCGAELGTGMEQLSQAGANAIQAARDSICNNGAPPRAGITQCVLNCIGSFTHTDGGTSDDIDARCRAFEVYACGANHQCGPSCVSEAGSDDGGLPPIHDAGITDADAAHDARD